MPAITCEKCRRLFTPTDDEVRGYLASSHGQKHALVICPHCGKHNKVAPQRLQQGVRFAAAVDSAPAVAPDAKADEPASS